MSTAGTPEHLEQQPVIIKKGAAKKSRAFLCTWNNYTNENLEWLKEVLGRTTKEYYINEEIAPTTGTPHLQFCFRFDNPRSWEATRKALPGCDVRISDNWNASKNYCKKIETAIAHHNSNNNITIKDPLNNREPRPFQQEIIELVATEPDDRTIYWYYDLHGNIGKTTLAKHLCIKYPDEILYISGKASDVKYGVTAFLYDKHTGQMTKNLRAVIFDAVRTSEKFISYEAIEAIKNGIFYNTKYESRMCVFNSPHVIVFSNFRPDTSTLSLDRWNITDLTIYD